MKIKPQFRANMSWLHTWAGICLGTVLFMIFWMGTLSVFDKEIDQWMQPETRFQASETPLGVDDIFSIAREAKPESQVSYFLTLLPRERRPFFEVYTEFANGDSYIDRLHPATGESLGPEKSLAASGFIYPMHYRLMIGESLGYAGYWIVAFATIFMMVLLVTGVVIHKKIFKDFFTFRPRNKIGRSSLDLHNITGTVFLPFHFVICLSGFAIFAGFYASLPFAVLKGLSPENRAVEFMYAASDYGYYSRPVSGEAAGDMVPISPLIEQAEAIWTERYDQPAEADRIDIRLYGDANAYIEVRRHFPSNRAEAHRDSINFDASTGEILKDWTASPVMQVRNWLEGFHQAQFDHWTLLWLYFIAGLSGCVLIATGFIFWVRSRRLKSASSQPLHLKLVEAMSIGSTTGALVATAAFLVINRLLEGQTEIWGLATQDVEVRAFFLVWAFTFIHGMARQERAWMDQSWMIGLLCLAAAVLNWITTGDHLVQSAADGLWSVFGVDISLLACSIFSAFAALRLRRGYNRAPQEGRVKKSGDISLASSD